MKAISQSRAAPEAADRPSRPISAGRRITVVRTAAELARLRPGWELLERRASAPMQTASWMRAAAESLYDGTRLQVVVLGGLDEPRAIAPLVRRRGRSELIGAAELREPTDLLFSDQRSAADLAVALGGLKLALLMRRLPADSPTVAALRAAHGPFAGVVARPHLGHPAIELSEGWTAPEGRLSKRRASDMRRARRHADALGEVRFEVLSPIPEQLEPLLDEAVGVEAAGWKARNGSALRTDARRLDFYRRYAREAALRNELRLCFMRVDGQAVAMQVAVEWCRRLWLLKIGYDEAFARCSPGKLLLLESTRWAAARRLRSVELLGDEAPWTQMWTDHVRPCVTMAVYPARPNGAVALAGDLAQITANRLAGLRRHRARA